MKGLGLDSIVVSEVTGVRYRLRDILGSGGFGTAYRAERHDDPDDPVCIKIIEDDQASWHREAYFGELLRRVDRAIQVFDSFVLVDRRPLTVRYCLALELAEHGSLADYLDAGGAPWNEQAAVREIIGLLQVLDHLHQGGALHRDLTPFNVFVCKGRRLKLGDFGIARHARGPGLPADVFNAWFASVGMYREERHLWRGADDTWQVAQLLGVLLTGSTENVVTTKNLKRLPCHDDLRETIGCAIGPRRHRFASAFEMIERLRQPTVERRKTDRVTTLEDKVVVFTGAMSTRRPDAVALLRRAGGTAANTVSERVDVVVRGADSPNFMAGSAGRKLLAVQRLRERGHRIRVIDEATFRRLVERR